jgi:hypothetical protein
MRKINLTDALRRSQTRTYRVRWAFDYEQPRTDVPAGII